MAESRIVGLGRRIRDTWVAHPRLDLVIVLLLGVGSVILWFRNSALAIGSDLTIPFHPATRLAHFTSAYNFWIAAGSQNPPLYGAPDFVETLSFYLFQPLGQIQTIQLAFLGLVYSVGAASVYFLTLFMVRAVRYARISALSAALFFLYNPFLFSDNYSQIVSTSVPRAAFPLFLALLIKGLESGRLRYAAALGIASFLVAITFPIEQYAVFVALLGGLVVVVFLVSPMSLSSLRAKLVARGRFLGVALALIVLSNLYIVWYLLSLFGLLVVPYQGFAPNLDVGTSLTLHNAFRLLGAWPFYSTYAGIPYVPYSGGYLQNPALQALGFAIPILAFSAILWRPRQRSVRLMTVAALVAVFLAKNYNPPFGEVFDFLVRSVPGFKLFYGGWPFVDVLAIVYATLIGVSIGGIAERAAAPRPARANRDRLLHRFDSRTEGTVVLSVSLLLVLLLGISWPLVTGDVSANWIQPGQRGIAVPGAYGAVDSWLQANDPNGRVFVLPTLGTYFATTWGYQGTAAFYQTVLENPLIQTTSGEYNIGQDESAHLISSAYAASSQLFLEPRSQGIWNGSTSAPTWQIAQPSPPGLDSLVNSSSGGQPILVWTIRDNRSDQPHELLLPWSGSLDAFQVVVVNLSQPSLPDLLASRLAFRIWDANHSLASYAFSPTALTPAGQETVATFKVGVPDDGIYDAARVVSFSLEYTPSGDGSTWQIGLRNVEASAAAPDAGHLASLLSLLGVRHVLLDSSTLSPLYPGLDIATPSAALSHAAWFTPELSQGFLRLYGLDRSSPLFGTATHAVFYNATSEVDQLADALATAPGTVALNMSQLSARDLDSLRSVGPASPTWEPAIEGPAMYRAVYTASNPFVLTLNVGYSDTWAVDIDGAPVALAHPVVNGYANGWIVTQTGSHTITISYARQVGYSAALFGTFATLVVESSGIVAVWMLDRVRRRTSRRTPG